jgi:hypothetical protein
LLVPDTAEPETARDDPPTPPAAPLFSAAPPHPQKPATQVPAGMSSSKNLTERTNRLRTTKQEKRNRDSIEDGEARGQGEAGASLNAGDNTNASAPAETPPTTSGAGGALYPRMTRNIRLESDR